VKELRQQKLIRGGTQVESAPTVLIAASRHQQMSSGPRF